MSAPWVKFFFGLSLHIFLWKMRATPGTCTKQGCLARRPFCHKVNLPASCRRRSNSIPWWTSFHVMLSLRTWHIMISNLQHPKGFTCVSLSVENYRLCARSQLISFARFTRRTQAWGEPRENQNHDWSKKWFQQNSRYAVKLITKGGFITASRSQELSLQRQLQIKCDLSMR